MCQNIFERYEQYLAYEKGASELTIRAYLSDLDKWLEVEQHSRSDEAVLDFLKSVDVRRARKSVLKLMQRGDAARSVQRSLSSLRSFYTYLMKLGVVAVNPFKSVQVPKGHQVLPTFVNAQVLTHRIEQLYEDAEEAELEADRRKLWLVAFVVDFLFQTGLRSAELRALRVENLRLSEGAIKVLGKRKKERIEIGRAHV